METIGGWDLNSSHNNLCCRENFPATDNNFWNLFVLKSEFVGGRTVVNALKLDCNCIKHNEPVES